MWLPLLSLHGALASQDLPPWGDPTQATRPPSAADVPPKACPASGGASGSLPRRGWASWRTYELEHVPVEHVVVGEALAVEEIPEELPQVGVVGLVVKAQGAAEVQVRGELSCETRGEALASTPDCMSGDATATSHCCLGH